MIRKKRQYFGEILVKKGLITDQQLQEAVQEQMRNKKFIGMMLVERGLIEEKDLLETLAEQFSVECMTLKSDTIDWDIAMRFSSSLITDHKCLPLQEDDETLTLAITNPLDVWVLDKAQQEAAPRKLKVVLVSMSDMDEAVKEYRRRTIRKMMNKWKKD